MKTDVLLLSVLIGALAPLGLSHFLSPLQLALLVALGALLSRYLRQPALLCFALAFVLNHLHLQQLIDEQLPVELEGRDLQLQLKVIDVSGSDADYQRFVATVLKGENLRGRRFRLSWKTDNRVVPGDIWTMRVRLKRPRGLVNPAGFDYQAWLLARGLSGSGYVRSSLSRRPDSRSGEHLARLRAALATFIDGIPTLRHPAFIKALLLGDSRGLSQREWDLLQATGTVHLMAISGLHVGLVAGFAFAIAGFLGRFPQRISPWIRLRLLPSLLSIASAAFYAALAGMSIPTRRAVMIVLLINLVWMFGRATRFAHLLLLSACAVCLLNPFAPTQAGFWLSYCSVFFLVYAFSGRFHRRPRFASFLYAQWLMALALIAPLAALKLPVGDVAPLANVVAIPALSFLILPMIFVAAFAISLNAFLAAGVFHAADFLLDWMLQFLRVIDHFSSLFYFSHLSAIALLIFFGGTLLVFAPAGLRLRSCGAVLCLAVFLHSAHRDAKYSVSVLDVGQGLSVFAEAGSQSLLYDVGAKYSASFDMGSRVVAPYLHSVGITSLDNLIISHNDNDHAGGLAGLQKSIASKHLWWGQRLPGYRGSAQFCDNFDDPSGSSDLRIRVLWPTASDRRFIHKDNNASCVVLLEIRGATILLTGDIEARVERALLASDRLPSSVDILVAAHHGSATSSTPAFIARVHPRQVVFSTGYRNQFHHPAKKVVQRFASAGVAMWNTASDGAVTFEFEADGRIVASAARCVNSRMWWDRPERCAQILR